MILAAARSEAVCAPILHPKGRACRGDFTGAWRNVKTLLTEHGNLDRSLVKMRMVRSSLRCPEQMNTAPHGIRQGIKRGVTTRLPARAGSNPAALTNSMPGGLNRLGASAWSLGVKGCLPGSNFPPTRRGARRAILDGDVFEGGLRPVFARRREGQFCGRIQRGSSRRSPVTLLTKAFHRTPAIFDASSASIRNRDAARIGPTARAGIPKASGTSRPTLIPGLPFNAVAEVDACCLSARGNLFCQRQ